MVKSFVVLLVWASCFSAGPVGAGEVSEKQTTLGDTVLVERSDGTRAVNFPGGRALFLDPDKKASYYSEDGTLLDEGTWDPSEASVEGIEALEKDQVGIVTKLLQRSSEESKTSEAGAGSDAQIEWVHEKSN